MLLQTHTIKFSHCLTESGSPLSILNTLSVSLIPIGSKQLTPYLGINALLGRYSFGAQNIFFP